MKLSQLIRYKNMIDSMTTEGLLGNSTAALTQMHNDIDNGMGDLDMQGNLYSLDYAIEHVELAFKSVENVLLATQLDLQKIRDELEQQAMLDSYTIYQNNASMPDKTTHVMQKLAPLTVMYDKDDIELYRTRIKSHGSWKHAGLFIRPLKGYYVDCMLACDPLYVFDETDGLLEPTRKLFTPQYQRRLRYNVIDEESSEKYILDNLPVGQLGFILVNDFFTTRPFEIINNYLKEFWDALKPGGVVMFTYNNGDIPGAVENFEAGLYCYTPGNLLRAMIEKLGYEIINQTDTDQNVSWFEIKKPGELESLRGGQTLGKIKSTKPIA